jgi:hypothetical protein
MGAMVYEHVARQLGLGFEAVFAHPDRTLYRHRRAVLKRLGVTSWGATARELAESAMIKTAKARTDPADIINAAVDALIRHRFELPALIALRRLAGTARETPPSRSARRAKSLQGIRAVPSATRHGLVLPAWAGVKRQPPRGVSEPI